MNIRLWQKEDLKRGFLEALENLRPLGNLTVGDASKIFDEMSASSFYKVFVAEYNGQVVGSITLLLEKKFIHGGGLVGHIEDVAVRQGFEGNGIGSELVKKAIEEAKKQGCYKVVLDCDENLVAFYYQQGFIKSGAFMRLYLL